MTTSSVQQEAQGRVCVCLIVCLFCLSGGMSEDQCRGRAPLAMTVVVRGGRAFTGTGGGGLTQHPPRVQRVLQDGRWCRQSVRVIVWRRVDQARLRPHPCHQCRCSIGQHCLDLPNQRHESGACGGRCTQGSGRCQYGGGAWEDTRSLLRDARCCERKGEGCWVWVTGKGRVYKKGRGFSMLAVKRQNENLNQTVWMASKTLHASCFSF